MEPSGNYDQAHLSESVVEFESETNNSETTFNFNPKIYFTCKLCRITFPTLDILFKHKQKEHSVAELKDIKFIVFEEIFVEDEDEVFFSTLLPRNEDSRWRIKTKFPQVASSQWRNQDFFLGHGLPGLPAGYATASSNGDYSCIEQQEEVNDRKNHVQEQHKSKRRFSETESETSGHQILDSSESNLNCNSTKPNPFVLLFRMTAEEVRDAKISLKNPKLRKTTSEFNSDICVRNERANFLEREKPNYNKTLSSSSSSSKPNLELETTDFIILDIIPKGNGLREISFSTSNKPITEQQQNSIQNRDPDLIPKPERGELSQPHEEELAEEVPMTEPTSDPDPNSEHVKFQGNEESLPTPLVPDMEIKSNMEPNKSSAKSVPDSGNGSICTNKTAENPSTESFKEWLEAYKKKFPESIILLDPDPTAILAESVRLPLKCRLCNRKFESEDLTKEHVNVCWRYNKINHKYCFKCDKTFSRQSILKMHNHSKHGEPGRVYKKPPILCCPTCGKNFRGGKTALKSHMATHKNPENREKNFVCEICGSSFYKIDSLKLHIQTHSEERPYKCTKCPRAFKTSNACESHKRIHLNITYSCSLCDKKYSARHSLREHTKASHSGEKPYACPLGKKKCPLKFSTRSQLAGHCRREHPETLKSSKIPCTLCSKTFWGNFNLKIHMMTHTGEKPLKCDGCGASFWKPRALERHCRVLCPKKVSEERKKFPCRHCPRKFCGMQELKAHLKEQEKGKVSGSNRVKDGIKRERKKVSILFCEPVNIKAGK